jgi:hypothetical protein
MLNLDFKRLAGFIRKPLLFPEKQRLPFWAKKMGYRLILSRFCRFPP